MREIMFRGKRMDNGEWIYGNHIGTDVIVGDIVEWDSDYFCTEFWWKVDPETVGQYTGLKDRNGKEIYEGDITESEEMEYSDSGHFVGMRKVIGVVVYTSGRFALHHVTGKLPDLNFGLNYHKVIGNRYENPELLGGTGA